jgi:Tfp pilus assembly protein PilF
MHSTGQTAAARTGILIALCFVAGCAQQRVAQPPAIAAAAVEANRRADAQVRRGDLESAVQQYREALRLAQSIEDADAIAANAINLSIVYQRLGRSDEARGVLAPLADQSPLAFSAQRLAQADVRRAVLDIEQKRGDSAATWLVQAERHCQAGCQLAAVIQNLRGQLALDAGRFDAAGASAQLALAAARAANDRLETANALRLAGNAAMGAGDNARAMASFNEALAIDHELAQPRKILLDLTGLGHAARRAGDLPAARSAFDRALAVAVAERDTHAAAELRALVSALEAQK